MINVRQREQSPVIQGIGDIFLEAATEFRVTYPNYVGNLPVAEKRMKDELDKNAEFKRFVEVGLTSGALNEYTLNLVVSNVQGILMPTVST